MIEVACWIVAYLAWGSYLAARMTWTDGEFGLLPAGAAQQIGRDVAIKLLRDELASIGLADTVAIEATKRGAAPLEATIRRADGSLVRLQGGGTPLPRDAVCG